MLQYRWVLYCTAQYSTVQFNTVLYNQVHVCLSTPVISLDAAY